MPIPQHDFPSIPICNDNYIAQHLNNSLYIPINPCPKPRMTQSDSWKKRPCVLRYRQFKDDLRYYRLTDLPEFFEVIFVVPFPSSYSKRKRKKLSHKPHKLKPDLDNYLKALLDAVFDKENTTTKGDQHVWKVYSSKIWQSETINDAGIYLSSPSRLLTRLE